MPFGLIVNGAVAEVFEGEQAPVLHPSLDVRDLAQTPEARVGWTPLPNGRFAAPAHNAEALRDESIVKVRAVQAQAVAAGVEITVGGRPVVFQGDADSRARLGAMAALGTDLPAQAAWLAADGEMVPMTAEIARRALAEMVRAEGLAGKTAYESLSRDVGDLVRPKVRGGGPGA